MAEKARNFVAIARAYAGAVAAGEIPACRWTIKACERQLEDLKKQKFKDWPYRFDHEKASRICRFIEKLPHIKGDWAKDGGRIRLEPWQVFILTAVFGWVHKKKRQQGLRLHQQRPDHPAPSGSSPHRNRCACSAPRTARKADAQAAKAAAEKAAKEKWPAERVRKRGTSDQASHHARPKPAAMLTTRLQVRRHAGRFACGHCSSAEDHGGASGQLIADMLCSVKYLTTGTPARYYSAMAAPAPLGLPTLCSCLTGDSGSLVHPGAP